MVRIKKLVNNPKIINLLNKRQISIIHNNAPNETLETKPILKIPINVRKIARKVSKIVLNIRYTLSVSFS
jgi:hypothetical protein